MTRSKIEAFFREFPFLESLVPQEKVQEVKVSRISPDLLLEKPSSNHGGPMDDYWIPDQITLLDKTGLMVSKVGFRLRYRNPNWRWRRIFRETRLWENPPNSNAVAELVKVAPNETIGDTLNSLTPTDQARVHYVVLLETANKEGHRKLTLFKPPKDFTLQKWVEEQVRREQNAVKEEVEKINQEAEPAIV